MIVTENAFLEVLVAGKVSLGFVTLALSGSVEQCIWVPELDGRPSTMKAGFVLINASDMIGRGPNGRL